MRYREGVGCGVQGVYKDREMTAYEELDAIHEEVLATTTVICRELYDASWALSNKAVTGKIASRIGKQTAYFAGLLHALLLSEGFDSVYAVNEVGYRQYIWVYLGQSAIDLTVYLIDICIHPAYPTLIYTQGPPYYGTIRELVAIVRRASGEQVAKGICSTCHYICRDLWVCGMGMVPAPHCTGYIRRQAWPR